MVHILTELLLHKIFIIIKFLLNTPSNNTNVSARVKGHQVELETASFLRCSMNTCKLTSSVRIGVLAPSCMKDIIIAQAKSKKKKFAQ